MKIEQDKIIKMVGEYPGSRFWMDLYEECGSLLDKRIKNDWDIVERFLEVRHSVK